MFLKAVKPFLRYGHFWILVIEWGQNWGKWKKSPSFIRILFLYRNFIWHVKITSWLYFGQFQPIIIRRYKANMPWTWLYLKVPAVSKIWPFLDFGHRMGPKLGQSLIIWGKWMIHANFHQGEFTNLAIVALWNCKISRLKWYYEALWTHF